MRLQPSTFNLQPFFLPPHRRPSVLIVEPLLQRREVFHHGAGVHLALAGEHLEPGEHQVIVQVGGRTHRRAVTVEAGQTASLVIANAPAPIESGWLVTRAGVPLQIFERGRLIGITDSERILLPGTPSETLPEPIPYRLMCEFVCSPSRKRISDQPDPSFWAAAASCHLKTDRSICRQ